MSNQAMLLFEERDCFSGRNGESMGNVQTGDGPFGIACLEWVLRGEQGIASRTGSEDLAHVVQVFAERVACTQGYLLEQVVGPNLCLQSMKIRESTIVARTNYAQAAVYPTQISRGRHGRIACIRKWWGLLGSGAR